MTLIIGIKCSDGVVIGSDGAASYVTPFGQTHTITQPMAKLGIIGDHFILGVSGPISLSQSYYHEIHNLVKARNNQVPWKQVLEARKAISATFWGHAKIAWERAQVVAQTTGAQAAIGEALHSSVAAFPLSDNESHLLQLSHQCQCEEATTHLPFVAIGSGQPTADPFLAFIRRVFWSQSSPTLGDGIFATLWALDYSIKAQPGGISEPIQVVSLSKDANGKWKARQLSDDEIGTHREMIQSVEGGLPDFAKRFFTQTPSDPIPMG